MVQQRKGVSTDGVETAVTEHQQARQTDYHVQAEAQNHVDHGQGGDIHRPARDHKRPRNSSN
ncbi:hypothetical protein D3C71_2218820 [compost metagenome]